MPSPAAIQDFLEERGQAVIFVLVLAIFSFIYREYLFFYKAFTFYGFVADSMTQFYPLDYFWLNRILSGSFSPWSFQIDLGWNAYPLLLDFNPFNLLMLLGGRTDFIDLLPYIMLLKFLAAACFFYGFLRQLSTSAPVAIITTLLYTFCGYMVINVHWYHYPNYAVFLAITLYLFERWVRTGRWLALVLTLGLLPLKGELQFFQLSFFFLGYGLYRLIALGQLSAKNYLRYLLTAGGFYAAGIGLASYVLMPVVQRVAGLGRLEEAAAVGHTSLFSKLGEFLAPESLSNLYVIAGRFFSNDFWGPWVNYTGMANYFEGPSVYCGLLVVVLASWLLLSGRTSLKNGSLLLICLALIPLLLPSVRQALNVFASATYKYQTLYISAFLLIAASRALQTVLRQPATELGKIFWIIIGLVLVLAIFPDHDPYLKRVHQLFSFPWMKVKVSAMLLLYGLCFGLAWKRPRLQPWLPIMLVGCVVLEVTLWGHYSVSSNSGAVSSGMAKRGDFYFNKNHQAAIDTIRREDPGFYRLERDFSDGGLNDAWIQNYYGTTGYVVASSGVTHFYDALLLSGASHRSSSYRFGLSDRVALHALLNVKYFLSTERKELPGYEPWKVVGDVSIFKNSNFLPLGVLYEKQVAEELFNLQTREVKDRIVLQALVTDKQYPGVAALSPTQVHELSAPTTPAHFAATITALRRSVLTISDFQESRIAGTITAAERGLLFYAIPYDSGWHAVVDGREVATEEVDYGFIGVPLDKGEHEVVLTFTPSFQILGPVVSALLLLLVLLVHRYVPVIRLGAWQNAA